MIKFLGQLPRRCVLAFSGGVDSVAIADFLLNGKRELQLAFFHHGTKNSEDALNFVQQFANERRLNLYVGHLSRDKKSDESWEEYWRNQRYDFLNQFTDPVITGHHLNDAAESWIFSSLHGGGKLIPVTRGNIVRPFLITPKEELVDWCTRRNLKWCEDSSNADPRFIRNLIRHQLMPTALKVNPGLLTLIRKKYLNNSEVV
jgi:tRNA(Ile)-lysidine synthase